MKTISILLASALLCILAIPAYADTVSKLPMNQVYQGPIHLPDFNGRDSEYAHFRTRITNEMKTGPNFAGHYAIVTVGCGTSCNFSFVGDVATGKVYGFPYGGEEYYMLQLRYGVKDNFISVRWVDNNVCYSDSITWNGNEFTSTGKTVIGEREKCDY